MRITSGNFKGRKLKVPSSKFTRPTTDRVKESIFNILNNYIVFSGIEVCDIYSGSGALGLESLSRGADSVHFVEKNFPVYKVLQENIKLVEAEEQTKIYKMDAMKFTDLKEHSVYDLILCDPPFFKDDIYKVFENLLKNKFLKDEGIIIIERSIQTVEKDSKAFDLEPFKRLGDCVLYKYEN